MKTKLSVTKIKALVAPGRYADGGTLYLNVAPGGSKQWVQRLTIGGRRHDMGLGGWPVVSLAEARETAFENRKLVRRGGDPLADKRRAKAPTFKQAAQQTYEALRPRWRSEKVAANWLQQLERHAMRRLGALPVDRIGRADVLAVLVPIWTAKPETARRVRRCIRSTLDWAMANGYTDVNLAADAINGALPRLPAVKKHLRALPYGEVADAMQIIEASNASL